MITAALALFPATVAAPPNVVYILADDVGYGDLSCYGATKVQTPNIDRIAKEGILFTDAHSPATVCTPTRYSLLTGEYSFRATKGGAGILPGNAPLCIDPKQPTMPKMFQHSGYRTGVVGKWHLGLTEGDPDWNKLLEPGAKSVGFDESFLIPATGDRVPCVYVKNGRVVGLDPNDPIQVSFKSKIGNDPTGRENPELLKIKPLVGHADTIINGVSRIGFMSGGKAARWVDEDMADTITKEAVDFIDRNGKKPFFLYFATHDVHAPLLPHDRFNGQSQAGLRGDTLRELDWSVGEVLKALDRNGVADNTIIVFTSDNGGVDNDGYGDPRENLNGHKVNGELRGTKYTLFEGGHRLPFVLRWPDRVRAGQTSDALLSQIDMYSSFAEALKHKMGEAEAVDSQPLLDALTGESKEGRSELLIHLGGQPSANVAYRRGPWMLIPQPQQNKAMLFNLERDLSQKENLAESRPGRVQSMLARLIELRGTPRTR